MKKSIILLVVLVALVSSIIVIANDDKALTSLGLSELKSATVRENTSNYMIVADYYTKEPKLAPIFETPVSLTATASITSALHYGKIMVISGSAASTYTLPEATGSGAVYRFIFAAVNTNGTVFKTADTTNCSFYGSVNILDKDAAAQAAYAPASTDDLMTLNGTTTGGQIGDYIEFIDMAVDKWCVRGQLQCPTGSNPATPFSGT